MFEGCLQAMAFYLAALGFTLDRDGWRFEPVPGGAVPRALPRPGHARPAAARLRGLRRPRSRRTRAHAVRRPPRHRRRREGVPRPPGWPAAGAGLAAGALAPARAARVQPSGELVPLPVLAAWRPGIGRRRGCPGRRRAAGRTAGAGRRGAADYAALLACAWGRPSPAFGARLRALRRPARPSRACPARRTTSCRRIVAIEGPLGWPGAGQRGRRRVRRARARPGTSSENGAPTMPFCVLMEAALQPCGWLASYVGSVAVVRGRSAVPQPRRHRARSCARSGRAPRRAHPGRAARHLAARRHDHRVLRRRCTMLGGPSGGEVAFEMETVFGFFPPAALGQPGRPAAVAGDAGQAGRARATTAWTCGPGRRRYCAGPARLPGPMLLMLDRITGVLARRRARPGSGGCARRRTSSPASGSSRRTSSRTRSCPARSASRR